MNNNKWSSNAYEWRISVIDYNIIESCIIDQDIAKIAVYKVGSIGNMHSVN